MGYLKIVNLFVGFPVYNKTTNQLLNTYVFKNIGQN